MEDYEFQIRKMVETDNNTVFVDFTHLQGYDLELAEAIQFEYYRFDPFLRLALREAMSQLGFSSYIMDKEIQRFVYFLTQTRLTYAQRSVCGFLQFAIY